MSTLQLLVIALVQGITEFLPISSSGHLILIPELTSWPDQGVLIDLAVHIGTLIAVMVYFRRDTMGLVLGAAATLRLPAAQRAVEGTLYARLFPLLALATVPTVIAGLVLAKLDLIDALRSAEVIGWTSLGFGMLLYTVDVRAPRMLTTERMEIKQAMLVGFAQVLALIPGTSRAGITMTAGRALGLTRPEAARFSMLLSIPTILAGGTLAALEIADSGNAGLIRDALVAGGLACLSAFAAIHLLMRWLTHASMTIFVIYRCLLGIGLLVYVYLG